MLGISVPVRNLFMIFMVSGRCEDVNLLSEMMFIEQLK
jgi:hypothetical protein